MKRTFAALFVTFAVGLVLLRPHPARMVLLAPPELGVVELLQDPALSSRWASRLQAQGAPPSLLEACHSLRPGAQELGPGLWQISLSGLPPQQARQALAALADCLLPPPPQNGPLEGAEQQQTLEEREAELIASLWSRAEREPLASGRRLELLAAHSERYLQSYLEHVAGQWRQEMSRLQAHPELILVVPPEVSP